MKRIGKRPARCLAAALCLALAATPALAQDESVLTELVGTAKTLAFGTENVTASVEADFSWDGAQFKHLSAKRAQAGEDSATTVSVLTIKDGEQVAEGGYSVCNEGRQVYSWQNDQDFYMEGRTTPRNALLRSSLIRQAAVALLEARLSEVKADVSSVDAAQGRTYQISLDADSLPAGTNEALTFIAISALRYRGYPNDTYGDGVTVEYEDAQASMKAWILANTDLTEETAAIYASGSDIPQDSMKDYWKVSDAYYSFINDTTNQYDSGVVLIGADCKTTWFATEDEFVRANPDSLRLRYEDMDNAVRLYYNHLTASDMTMDDYGQMVSIMNSDAYRVLLDGAQAYYADAARASLKDAVAAYVNKDGTVKAFDSVAQLARAGQTITNQILNGLTTLSVKSAEATVSLDDQGRLTAVDGTLSLTIVNREGESHELTVTMSATAADYGATKMDPFDPENSGLVTYDEFMGN